ncbi:hypothetical protein [Rubneribacter sp.]
MAKMVGTRISRAVPRFDGMANLSRQARFSRRKPCARSLRLEGIRCE